MNKHVLRQNIVDEFDFDPSFDGAHIGIAVEGQVVTLTGYVESYAEKLAAVAAARRVKGVRAIADDIEIRYPTQPKTADDQIAKRALDILKWDAALSRYPIEVVVGTGWVTLTGTVNWEFEKRAAEKWIRKLPGVIGVINHIKLRPRAAVADVKKKIEAALVRRAALESGAIRVSVSGGDHVVLEGEAEGWDQRLAAEYAAWSVTGVMSVDNLITIR